MNRFFAFLAASLALFLSVATAQAQQLRLEEFFKGRTYAYGWFGAIDGTTRRFRVVLDGQWKGKVFALREAFEYEDGERDVKTWRFKKTGPNTYTGTREDVIGETVVTVEGPRATFSYDVNLTPKAAQTIVRFSDVLLLEADGTLRNTATVWRWHLPVARVNVNFARTEAGAKAIRP